MIDRFLAGLREPRFGIAVLTTVVSLLMAAHWTPMMYPGLLLLVVSVVRPSYVVAPAVWWVFAALWLAAVVARQDRMEDHVWLFTAWLVALAVSLSAPSAATASAGDDEFLDHAARHARLLVGVTFSVAVLWKLAFNQFWNGTALWTFVVTDDRFDPLTRALGIPGETLADASTRIESVLSGGAASYDPPSDLLLRIAVVAVLTLLLEAAVAVAFLAPDGSLPARLRAPSIVTFGLATYALVPVLGFAALLATLTTVVYRWRRSVAWIFPVMVAAALLRVVTLQV